MEKTRTEYLFNVVDDEGKTQTYGPFTERGLSKATKSHAENAEIDSYVVREWTLSEEVTLSPLELAPFMEARKAAGRRAELDAEIAKLVAERKALDEAEEAAADAQAAEEDRINAEALAR